MTECRFASKFRADMAAGSIGGCIFERRRMRSRILQAGQTRSRQAKCHFLPNCPLRARVKNEKARLGWAGHKAVQIGGLLGLYCVEVGRRIIPNVIQMFRTLFDAPAGWLVGIKFETWCPCFRAIPALVPAVSLREDRNLLPHHCRFLLISANKVRNLAFYLS
jgi:hypothetical protein